MKLFGQNSSTSKVAKTLKIPEETLLRLRPLLEVDSEILKRALITGITAELLPHFPANFQRWKRGDEKFLRQLITTKETDPSVPKQIAKSSRLRSKRKPSNFAGLKLPMKRVVTPPPTTTPPTQDASPPENQKPARSTTPPNETSILAQETPANVIDLDSAGQTMSTEKNFRSLTDSALDSPTL